MEKSKIKKHKFINFLYPIMIILGIFFLIIYPSIAIDAFFQGLRIWATKLLPALLPFFILTKLLAYTPVITKFGQVLSPITSKLYGVGGVSGYIYIMSIISGYPVGAKLTSDIYSANIITKNQAHTISAFTSTSGPLFIIGTVAIGLYKNAKLGLVIILSHFLGALINGLLYRNKKTAKTLEYNNNQNQNPLQESMTSSITSILIVGGFVALFYMFLQLFISLNLFTPITWLGSLFGIPENISLGIICGIIEVTSGCIYLSYSPINNLILCTISTFLISFGGLSIHAQAFCYLKNFEMPYIKFFLQKLSHGIISTILSILLFLLIF